MKITKRQLKQIIKEEIQRILTENEAEPWPDPGTPEWDTRMETIPQWSDEYADQMLRLRSQELGDTADEPYCGPFGCAPDEEENPVASR